jgi:hypothetical protein
MMAWCCVLQTWNPQAMEHAQSSGAGGASKGSAAAAAAPPIAEELIISRAWFDRPVVTLETPRQLATIKAEQGHGNLWVIGSYSLPGVPLLENAARSGMNVAETLRPGAYRPWRRQETGEKGEEEEEDALSVAAAGGARPGYLKPGNCLIGARASSLPSTLFPLLCSFVPLSALLLLPVDYCMPAVHIYDILTITMLCHAVWFGL